VTDEQATWVVDSMGAHNVSAGRFGGDARCLGYAVASGELDCTDSHADARSVDSTAADSATANFTATNFTATDHSTADSTTSRTADRHAASAGAYRDAGVGRPYASPAAVAVCYPDGWRDAVNGRAAGNGGHVDRNAG